MQSSRMKDMWNLRAQQDAFYYVESAFWNGNIDAFFALGEERARLLIDPIIAQLPFPATSADALEVGCGVGRFSRALARRFRSVLAIDVSDEMVRQARELHPCDEYPNLQFNATDGSSLSCLSESSVDFVFSYEVFQHMPSPQVILNNFCEIQRVLRPTGIALIHLRTEALLTVATAKKILKRCLPASVWSFLGFPPFTFDPRWTGTSLSRRRIQHMCAMVGLDVLRFIDDPTHAHGERVFLFARPAVL